jgi:hypothetical protein
MVRFMLRADGVGHGTETSCDATSGSARQTKTAADFVIFIVKCVKIRSRLPSASLVVDNKVLRTQRLESGS